MTCTRAAWRRWTSGLLLAVLPLCAQAWNARGHAAVAAIAASQLTSEATAAVGDLLRDDLDRYGRPSHRKSLMEIASWPDEIRAEAVKTDPAAYRGWHVRSNDVCSDRRGPCRNGHCVDQLIIHYTQQLGERALPARTRNEALKWVVHLVGDLHQPLHSAINRNGGGAKVWLVGHALAPKASFHSVWDDELLDAALAGWRREAVAAPRGPLPLDAPTRWMEETRQRALHEVYEPLPGFACGARLAEPIVLDPAYQARSVGFVREQITLAGLRLAQLLNNTLR